MKSPAQENRIKMIVVVMFQEIQVHILELLELHVATFNKSLHFSVNAEKWNYTSFTLFLPCLLVCLASLYHTFPRKDRSNLFPL